MFVLQYGNGLVFSLENGNFKNIQSPEAVCQLVRIQVCQGTVIFVGCKSVTPWLEAMDISKCFAFGVLDCVPFHYANYDFACLS